MYPFVCLVGTEVITILANESTLWLESWSSDITMSGLVVHSPDWAVSTLLVYYIHIHDIILIRSQFMNWKEIFRRRN